jgi:hypothetical protein
VSEVKVTQADRDIAAEYMRRFPDLRLPEAFARHRQSATTEALAAMEQVRDALQAAWPFVPYDDPKRAVAVEALATLTAKIEEMRDEQG